MTAHRLLTLVRRRIVLVIVGILIGVLLAVGYTAHATPTYSATARLYVSTTTLDRTGSELVNAGLYAGSQVTSFAQVVTTAAVLDGVISDLGLHMSPADLASEITVSVPLNTVVLVVEVHDSDARRAAAIANAVAQRLPQVIESLTKPQPTATAPTKVNLLEGATVPTSAISPNAKLNVLAGLIGGLALGLIAAGIAEALRRRPASVAEVEESTGIPVLGVLPDYRAKSTDLDALRLVWTSAIASAGRAPRTLLLASLSDSSAPRLVQRLAQVVAETERPVVWADADLRGARAAAALDVTRSPGMSDVLSAGAPADTTLHRWNDSTLLVMPGGSQHEEPGRLFANAAMGRLVHDLRAKAETVVLDATATTTVAELAVLAQYADATVLVVSPSMQRRALAQSVRELRAAGVRITGVLVDGLRDRDRADFERRLIDDVELVDY